jgi:hypothetical protein
MHLKLDPDPDPVPTLDGRLSAGLTALGLVASTAAVFAVLTMWTLLTSPDRVASAASGGVPAILKVVVSVVIEAARPLLAWL